jgi:hypothetical protein
VWCGADALQSEVTEYPLLHCDRQSEREDFQFAHHRRRGRALAGALPCRAAAPRNRAALVSDTTWATHG